MSHQQASGLHPPHADTRRQATGAVKGYDYQIWQAVDLWASLPDNEALFLEAAEDVDRVSPGLIETGQVKTTLRPVTLRSQAVQDVLRHHWEHRQRNPNLVVTSALITTAGRAVEAGQPFGDTPGLDVWDRARSPLGDLGALRAFLLTLGLGDAVGTFLGTATDDELRRDLVQRVRWATDEPDREGLRSSVERKVVLHGDRMHLSPSQSRAAVDALFARAWNVVTSDGPRRLDRVSFLDTFEEATAVLTSRSVLAPTDAASGTLSARVARTRLDPATVLVRTPVRREQLVQTVREHLAGVEVLALVGSSGMGKSTLAALVAQSGGDWVRLDLRGLHDVDAADRIDVAAFAVDRLPEGGGVVVDDVPASDMGHLDRPLAALVEAVRGRGGRVLVTTQTPLPDAVLAAVGQSGSDSHVDVPPLSAIELAELCASQGCPEGQTDRWARVLQVQTSGHPQLAAAHARGLAERGWGRASDEDVFGTPPPIRQVKQEARRRLAAHLSGLGTAADLAYQLSVYAVPFTRTQALRFAAAPPALAGAGDALDVLIGPWLERVGNDHFRVSPLLGKSCNTQFDPDTVKRLHYAAALSFLEPVVDQQALNGLLLHGLVGECEDALIAAFWSVSEMDDETFGMLAEWISWLAYAAVDGERTTLYPPNPLVSVFLRSLQVRVALALGKEDAAVDALRMALHELDNAGTVGVALTTEALRCQFATQAVCHIEGSKHFPFVLEQAATVARIAGAGVLREMETMAASAGLAAPRHRDGMTSLDDAVGPTMSLLLIRGRSAADLNELLDAVEREPALATALAPLLRDDVPASAALADSAWLDVYRLEGDNAAKKAAWLTSAEGLDRAVGYAEANGLRALATCARRSLATVYFEHLGDEAAALGVLDAGEAGRPEIEEYRAKMKALNHDYAAALDLYAQILPGWESGPGRVNTLRAYSFQDAIHAAAMVGRFDAAAELARRAVAVADEELRRVASPLPLGYRADLALALYRSGQQAAAVTTFAEVLSRLDEAPTRMGFGLLRDRVGHTLVVLELELGGKPAPEGYQEPRPGVFSRPEPNHADVEAAASPVLVWGRLAHIESLIGPATAVQERFLDMSATTEDPLVAYDRSQVLAARALVTGAPEVVAAVYESYRRAAAGAGKLDLTALTSDYDPARTALALSCVVATADFRLAALPVDAWLHDAESLLQLKASDLNALRRWADTARLAADLERGRRRAGPPLWQRLQHADEDAGVRATAAAALAAHSGDPDTLFYARVSVIQFAAGRVFSEHVERAVSALILGDRGGTFGECAGLLLSSTSRFTLGENVRELLEQITSGATR